MPIRRYIAQDLLYNHLQNDRFWNNISITQREWELLEDSRKKVHTKLVDAFSKLRGGTIDKRYLIVESQDPVLHASLAKVIPKFRRQGSSVYKTLNDPAHTPPQQIDVDYGVYLPMNVIEGNPVIGKEIFFKIVDGALAELVSDEGWLDFQEKNTCARILVNQKIHVDVPLYAIPNEKFAVFAKALIDANGEQPDVLQPFTEEIELDTSEIYLAVRNQEHWKKSDPSKIELWFVIQVQNYGERFRRVCRYLKAWRDYVWKEGGPASIVLMIAVWETFRSSQSFNYDCEALLKVAEELPQRLSSEIFNPADDSEDPEEMYPRDTSAEGLAEYRSRASELASGLRDALCHAKDPDAVVAHLKSIFGPRVPSLPALVTAAQVAAQVRSQRSLKQKEPTNVPKNLSSG